MIAPLPLPTTPANDGYRMPAEFEPHSAAWMLWPSRPDNWRNAAAPARRAYTAVAGAIARFEPVIMGARPEDCAGARAALPPSVSVVAISSDDAWMRDVGPTFVVDGRGGLRGVDWIFNAWGGEYNGLYDSWEQDDAVAWKVIEMAGVERYRAPIILEGGSIHTDGQGTLLTTAECLLSPGRNPLITLAEIEQTLCAYTGAEKVLWIPRGVFKDETTGHVDNLVCFLRPGEIALTWTDNRSDPQYERSAEAFDFLSSSRDARGRTLTVHKIHQPDPILITAEEAAGVQAVDGTLPRQPGDRMAASYINFFLCNGGAIVPVFDDPHDQPALQRLQELLPERKIVPVPAREILLGGGNIHCITQQQPAV
ncbi:MAG: agmatine deiminase [Anaerolineaceae bacterium]